MAMAVTGMPAVGGPGVSMAKPSSEGDDLFVEFGVGHGATLVVRRQIGGDAAVGQRRPWRWRRSASKMRKAFPSSPPCHEHL